MVCKISNFDLWTAKHLVQASCTELTLNRQDCKAKFSLATNFAFPALRAWYMCKTLHKVISPYGPHDKICNSKWLKKLFFMEVWFFSDFIILWQQKNAANLLSHIVYHFDCKDWKDKYFSDNFIKWTYMDVTFKTLCLLKSEYISSFYDLFCYYKFWKWRLTNLEFYLYLFYKLKKSQFTNSLHTSVIFERERQPYWLYSNSIAC